MSKINEPDREPSNPEKENATPIAEEMPQVETTDVEEADHAVLQEIGHRSRRSFLIGGAAALAAVAGWRWLKTRPEIDGLPYPLRLSHEFNERLSSALFSEGRLAPTFPVALAETPRVNGGEGLSDDFDPALWRLQVVGVADPTKYPQYHQSIDYLSEADNGADAGQSEDGQESDDEDDESDDEGDTADVKDSKDSQDVKDSKQSQDARAAAGDTEDEDNIPGLLLTLDDIKRLPRVEMTTQLKCIEGWSVIVRWAGARLHDFIEAYQPATRHGGAPDVRNRPGELVRYVGMETPDGDYYVGLDMESALHPQTLLCYEMNGQPLTMEHGAPLRLVVPVKYGIKHIKRIGRITFTDERPADFWAERGYDWYSGH